MQAVRDRASDIHFEPHETEVKVRLRIDGVLHEVTPPPKALYSGVVTRIKILSNMDISERRLPLDGRFKFGVHGRMIDVRVSSLPEVFGEKLVLRLLDRDALRVNMKDIGFGDDMLTRFHRILKEPHGIILLTGPTGSGKTSTLYSALSFLRSPEVNIQTVEDPVEYQLRGINQMAVKSTIGLDFASGLRAILRQDPDIIMIGEIRDAETAQIAMRAALTGHLVLSTLHTNDAPSAFWRLRDIGVELYLIAATINLVISQRLVRWCATAASTRSNPTLEEVKVASLVDPQAHRGPITKGPAVRAATTPASAGALASLNFWKSPTTIRELIINGAGTVAVRQKALEEGMETLLASGLSQVKRGVTTVEEVLSVAPLGEMQRSR
jgi:type IV pilus assembly protein PilB